MAPMGPGTYGSQIGRPKKKKKMNRTPKTRPTQSKGPIIKGVKDAAQAAGVVGPLTKDVIGGMKKKAPQLKMNMQKMPPKVRQRLMDAMMKRKKQGRRYGS